MIASERSPVKNPQHRLFAFRNIDDFYAAVQHDKDAVGRVPLFEKDFTRVGAPLFGEFPKPRDLRIVQPGEHRLQLFRSFGHLYSSIIWSM